MKAYIGIDPGKLGGIAVVVSNKDPWACKMPDTERDIYDTIYSLREWCGLPSVACIEWVHSMPSQSAQSGFTFGMGYGGLRMALIAAGIPFAEVTPRKWQGALSCLTGGDKNISKAKAQQLFPSLKITHAIADALLIAEWGRRQHEMSKT